MMPRDNIIPFGCTESGENVSMIALDNGLISCKVLTFGATLHSLLVPDRNGVPVDIVLGYDSLAEYENQDGYLGATIGRYANRIANGKFTLNEKNYDLAINNGPNHLHGGLKGFSHRVWSIEEAITDSVKLSLFSYDGEEAYPGNLKLFVTYALCGNSLSIHYEAISDADTVCNLTNHSYFNLNGSGSGNVLDQEIMINAGFYTPSNAESIPYGDISPVDNTPMDLRQFTKIGEKIEYNFTQLVQGRGYDHNYVIDGEFTALKTAARAFSEKSGITMLLETTLPGVQFYTANFLDEGRTGKNNAVYGPRHGFCLETQFYPDSPNQTAFPTTVLKSGEKYDHTTVFTFSLI